ncbi:SDR family oxidoreductase [Streptomyces sp. NPDC097610]|uniref:SDR family oxidoreductase n=1 Tax=Streptomyces sp. NPDC097610 TaxID=3157227 RepID=UPI0033213C7A
MRLSGKTALVTGAARGLGRACATAFAKEGADLALLDIAGDLDQVPYPLGSASQLAHTVELCRDLGASVLAQAVDVRDANAVDAAVDAAVARFGAIDILVNSAGIAAPSGKIAHDIDEGEWNLMLDVDLSGAWRLIRAVGGRMVERGSGSIINIASTAGLVGYRHFAAYVAAKHGLVGLTKAVALDYAPRLDVPVNEHEDTFVQSQPMNALVEPEDIAAAALWLASDESRQVTGSVVTVDGGFTAR